MKRIFEKLAFANVFAPQSVEASTEKTTVFPDRVGTEPPVVALSYQVSPLHGRYVAVKLQHDAAAAVVCGVLAAADGMYLPPANGMTLVV